MTDDTQGKPMVTTPEGRLINNSIFTKDIYKDPATGKEGVASYKIEMAFEAGVLEGVDEKLSIDEELAQAAKAKWGAGAYDEYFDGKIRSPILNGDELAKRREDRGKTGEAYAGMDVIRAHTQFNEHGADAPGGIAVFGPDVAKIEPAAQQEIYNGCYGCARLTIDTYIESNTQRRALMFYLNAFQKTRDGDRLVAQQDHAGAFKPVGRTEGGESKRRRARG